MLVFDLYTGVGKQKMNKVNPHWLAVFTKKIWICAAGKGFLLLFLVSGVFFGAGLMAARVLSVDLFFG